MKKPLQFKQVLAALLTIAALASGLTAHATIQSGIMMQGLTRTINNETRFAFVIQSNWGGDQITNLTGSSYTFSNATMIHGTVDVTLNGTLNFQVGTAFADVITASSFTVTIESSSLWFYGATVQTKSGTNVSGCTTTVSSNKHTLTVTIPSGKTFGSVILDYVPNPPMATSNTTVTVPAGDYWVSNSSHKPKPEPTVVYGQTTLVKDTDYTLSWGNNSSAGTGTVTVTGIGNYAGSVTGTFSIRWARYYVHFDKNHDDATGTMSDQLFTYNTAQALSANTFSRTDYAFKGWCTTSNGAVTYTEGQSVSNLTVEDGQTVTLYAKWIPIPCIVPENFAVDSVTATTAEFSWIGNPYTESYQIIYREAERVNVLFSENFEDETTLANWTAISNNTANTTNGRYGRLSSAAHNGSYGYSFSSYSSASDYNQYLISPELTVSGNLEFYYKRSDNFGNEQFKVGYSSTGTEISDFTWGDEVNVSDDNWNLFFEAMPQGTKYVAINYYSYYKYELYIDDITIGTPVPAGAWQETTVMGAPQGQTNIVTGTVVDLDLETTYEAYVSIYCEYDEVTVQSDTITFTTLSLCDVPTNLTLNSNDGNSANISWQGWQDAFDVRYSTDQENWTVETTPETGIVLTGLASGTTYYVQVAAAGCEDAWSDVLSFATDCASTQSVPYAYDFEDDAPFNCWTPFADRVTRQSSTSNSHSGSYYMRFAGSTSNLVAMPQFGQDLSGLQLKFWTRPESCSNNSCGTFSVGYMTDLEDAGSFVEVNQYAYNDWTSNTYEQKTVFFINAPQGAYIAFRHNANVSFWYWFVDDVEVTVAPSCFPVENLVVEEIDIREVMFNWDLVDETQTEWTLEYADNADFENPVTVTAETYEDFLLEDLRPSTHYWARVAASCGTENSDWSNVVDFTTLDACAAPVLSQDVVTSTYEAMVAWTGTSNMYNLRYRTAEVSVPLFTEDFENETAFANWTAISNNTANTTNGRYGRLSSAAHNGSYGYSFSSYSYASDYNQYLISPELTVSGNLEFYYKQYSSPETFRVGYSSTGNAIEDFTWGDAINSTLNWTLFHEAIPEGTKYVAINYYSDYKYELYIDDISISTPVPAGEWTTVENIQADDYLIEGLTAGTDYEVQVQGVCVNEEPETWQWSNMLTFTTIPLPTFTKDILGYGNNDGSYYLIASPIGTVNPEDVANMTANAFDLYRFNPSNEDNEWENYKATSFNLENGMGYLYANSDTITLAFTGMPIAGDTYEVTLVYDANDEHKCWNLVGNPFPCEATLDREYYVLSADGLGINPEPVPATTPIPPCTAVFVKAVSAEDTVVFSKVTQ